MQDVGGRETGLPGILLDTLFVFMLGVGFGRVHILRKPNWVILRCFSYLFVCLGWGGAPSVL